MYPTLASIDKRYYLWRHKYRIYPMWKKYVPIQNRIIKLDGHMGKKYCQIRQLVRDNQIYTRDRIMPTHSRTICYTHWTNEMDQNDTDQHHVGIWICIPKINGLHHRMYHNLNRHFVKWDKYCILSDVSLPKSVMPIVVVVVRPAVTAAAVEIPIWHRPLSDRKMPMDVYYITSP